MVNNSPPNAKDADLIPGSGRSPGKRNKASLVAQLAKNLPAMQAIVGTDPGSIPELGRSPGEENGYSLQYFCLENSMDRGAWQAPVHGVGESRHA